MVRRKWIVWAAAWLLCATAASAQLTERELFASLSNKTFILRGFYTENTLHFHAGRPADSGLQDWTSAHLRRPDHQRPAQ